MKTRPSPVTGTGAAGRVAATIERYGLLDSRSRVLAAVSGGRDSTALAVLLPRLGYDVVIAHVDHAMRPGSERDAVHCAALAGLLGLPFRSVRLALRPVGEAEARRVRYRALEEMAAEVGAARIATGHTLDDAAETVAMRLGRGGAPVGIPPRRGAVVRPLLTLRRSDTGAVCREAGACWLDDPSNADERHLRNRVRRRAMPALGDATVARLASIGTDLAVRAQARRAAAEKAAAPILDTLGSRAEIDRPALARLQTPVARDVVRLALERLGIEAGGRLVADIVEMVAATGAGLDLPGGMRAWTDAGRVVIGTPQRPDDLPAVTLAAPGTTVSPHWGLTVVVDEAGAAKRLPGTGMEAVVDRSAAAGGLTLRPWQPGDRFVPLGGPGSTKLQDLFVNRKLPREQRRRVPVIATGNEIVWVAGFRIAERWKAHSGLGVGPKALRIRLLPLSIAGRPGDAPQGASREPERKALSQL